ncbi:universal stress protein [Nocardioides rubriscoriae]|uniref:universal stress protein n=1 Tax=Nocardioides rubriscoriae TaxID=642762 RepID=UPI0014793B96|nr:universal stress protein [Nocardioides rubriscoriae]
MWDNEPLRVVVAVGPEPTDALLRAAADEATRHRCGLHLVHVVAPTGRQDRASAVSALHAVAIRLAGLREGQEPPSTELCHGPVVPMLVAASSNACVVVVPRELPGPGESPAQRVAARCSVPVLVVPPVPLAQAPRHPARVSVGVDDVATSDPVVRGALQECERRGARLRVVHCVDERDRPGLDLAEVYAGWFAAHPRVPHEVVVERGVAHEVLLRHGEESDLLVVGRHEQWSPVLGRLGRTSEAVTALAPCPVLVVAVASLATAVLP